MKIYIQYFYLLFVAGLISTVSLAQQNTINLNQTEAGNQIHAACKKVVLSPGYKYAATLGNSMHSYIDQYKVCDLTFMGRKSTNGGAPDPLDNNYEVGTTEGAFNVSQSGATSYNILLVIPPGTGGMVPNLSISYNSGTSGGMLGIGWGLTGLSSITRTSQTIYHDNNVSPVSLDNNDRFELDGNRLIVTNGGVYGALNTEYGTEEETFQKISCTGIAGNDPIQFVVRTKDGSELFYGYTGDSRFFANGSNSKIIKWLLNKVRDNKGNYITITYTQDNAAGEYRPDHIDYTGNDMTGLAPYNQIKFVYGGNPDKQVSYIAGHQVKQSVLLVALEMYAEGTKMHEYDFNYTFDMGAHLVELIEKGSDDKQYNSTKFSWENTYDLKPIEKVIPYFNNKDGDYVSADVNGDGFDDVIKLSGNTWNLYQNIFSGGTVIFHPPASNNSGTLDPNIYFQADVPFGAYPRRTNHSASSCDLNGDGYDDMVVYLPPADGDDTYNFSYGGNGPAEFIFYLSNGTGLIKGDAHLINETDGIDIEDNDGNFVNLAYTLGDFNGDGITDLFTYNPRLSTWHFYTFKTGTPVLMASGNNSYYWEESQHYYLSGDPDFIPPAEQFPKLPDFYSFDMNGDGKDEIVSVGDGKRLYFSISTGWKTFFVSELTSAGTLHEILSDYYPAQSFSQFPDYGNENAIRFGDFNGDGKADMLIWKKGIYPEYIGAWHISYSTGTSFIQSPTSLPLSNFIPTPLPPYWDNNAGAENKHEYFVSDFNRDGKADILEKTTDGVNGTDLHTMYGTSNISTFIENSTNFGNNYSEPYYLFNVSNCIGDFNGDGHPDLLYHDGSTHRQSAYFSFFQNKYVHKIRQITNGLNFTTYIDYNTLPLLAKQNKYAKGSTSVFPVIDYQKSLVPVSKVTRTNGVGSLNETDYSYSGAKIHMQGKGFLGFSGMSITDVERNIKSENFYTEPIATNFFHSNLQESKTSLINSSGTIVAIIHDKSYEYQINDLGGKRNYTYVNHIIDNDVLHGNITDFTMHNDTYGNLDEQESSNSAESSLTTNSYEQKGAWIPSRLTSTSTIFYRSGSPSYTRTTDYTNDVWGQPVTISEDGGNTIITATYNFGNLLSTSISGIDIVTRSNTNVYDAKNRFVISQTNALGHIQQMTYDNKYGNILTSSDPNLLVIQNSYDGFGRLKQTRTPTNQVITNSLSWDNTGLTNSLFFVETAQSGMPTSRQYSDILGRVLRTQTTSFDGTNINTDNTFNNLGQIISTSNPYYENNAPVYNTYTYDNFLRPSTLNAASGATLTNTYSGNTTTTITSTGSGTQTVSQTLDASGLLTSVTDDGGTLGYTYHSCRQPLATSIPGTAQLITMTYDPLGRQITNSDPDAGTYTYSYNALGEIKSTLDPIGNLHDFTYDALGRTLANTPSSTTEGTITFTYDNKPQGLGYIGTVSTSGNFIGNQEYTYDNFSRPNSKTEINIDGANYTTSFQYDDLNRIVNENYPGGNFAVNFHYNSYGYLEQIKRANDNSLIWQCNAMTERGQVSNALSGNGSTTVKDFTGLGLLQNIQVINNANNLVWNQGYNFDPTNYNLLSRSDNLLNINHNIEEFQYDNLDRLTHITLNGATPKTTVYANSGNISSKSDVGTYDYTASQPHAVTSISSPVTTFPYLQQIVSYNEFKRANTINENINGNINEVFLMYGADYNRKKMVLKSNGVITSTKYYLGDYEKTVTPSNNTRELHYISGSDGLCAIYAKNKTAGVITDTMYYINTDHLGSIALISDPTGNVLQEVSYDAWGKRRLPTTWEASATPVHNLFDRGYTGHEHLDQVHLINMNARLYDPVVGRMLNADDYVQSPDFTQSFNRYSYAINNPLKFTDPTGNTNDFTTAETMQGEGILGFLRELDQDDKKKKKTKVDQGNNEINFTPIPLPPSFQFSMLPSDKSVLKSENVADTELNLDLKEGNGIVANPIESVRNYGGDGSGSFMDYSMFVADQINRFNPIANGWDAISGYITGNDRLGNHMSTTDKTLSAIGSIPFLSFEARAAGQGSQFLKFGGDEAIIHFEKHAGQIMKMTGQTSYNLKNYIDDANWIIKNGTFSPSLNGYFAYMGNAAKGESLFGFVGLKNGGFTISTFHIKSATQLGLK